MWPWRFPLLTDAESVILQLEEYEVHDVAGLLKEYFRELPDPLMTEDAYAHFVTASKSWQFELILVET